MRVQVSTQLRPWLGGASLVLLLQSFYCTVVAALNPIEIHGYKMFDSVTGEEFVVRGIAYEPRPNAGIWNQNSIDYFTEEHRHIWERDIPYLQSLGVNAVRLYAVDPTQNHDAFMCAMNAAGIYVLVSLARDCPTCAITRDEAPNCYPRQLKRQGEAVINAFSKYPNLLGFSAGNEVNHYTPHNNPEWNGTCQKRFLRDMRKYIASCSSMRKVPVGLVSADSQRDAVSLYYNCATNDEDDEDPYEHAEWFGLNVYLACNGSITDYEEEKGYTELVESFKSYNYSIPVMITEFGCLSETFPTVDGYEGQRTFQQARWLLEKEQLRDQFVGGYAFEYSIERQNAISESPYPFQTMGGQTYGIGYFSPEDCDDVTIPCQYNPEPCFDNLQEVYQDNFAKSTIHKDDFVIPPHRQGRTQCPTNFTTKLSSYQWKADRVRDLKCPSKGSDSNFICPANLDELRPKLASSSSEQQHQSIWVTLLEGILFLTVVSIIYAMLMSQVDRMSKNHEKYMSVEGPTWMTVVVPVSRSSSHGGTNTTTKGSSSSGSDCGGSCEEQSTDESAGLLSMKGWNQYHYYQSVDSDLSDESSGECQSSSQQEEEPDHHHHHRAQAFLSSSPPPYYRDYGAGV